MESAALHALQDDLTFANRRLAQHIENSRQVMERLSQTEAKINALPHSRTLSDNVIDIQRKIALLRSVK